MTDFLCDLDNEREFIVEAPTGSGPHCRIHSVYVGQHPVTRMIIVRTVFYSTCMLSNEIGLPVDAVQYIAELAKEQQYLSLISAAHDLKERAERAEGIVAKLPRTADGVPFVYGNVYVIGTSGGEPYIFVTTPATIRFVGDEPYIAYRWGAKIARCFSTREAAQASLSAQGAKE